MKSLFPFGSIIRSISPGRRRQPHHLYCRTLYDSSVVNLAVENEAMGIIEQADPMEPALEKVAPFLTSKIVSSILEQKRGNLELGFRFFIWAISKKHLRSWGFRNLVVDMLVGDSKDRSSRFVIYRKILGDMKECDCSVHSDAFTALILAHWRIKEAEMAAKTFGSMWEFNCKPDVLAYNAILHVLVKEDFIFLALAIYNVILKTNCQPNCATFNILIDGLCKGGMTRDALDLFDEMSESGVLPNKSTYTLILSGLCSAKRTDDAYKLFNEMKNKGCLPDSVTYNALLSGFCKLGRVDEAFALLNSFKKDGFHGTLKSYSCLVNGLVRAKKIDAAQELFQRISESGMTPDLVLYTTMMKGLSQAGRVNDALNLLTDMTGRGIIPDTQCYNTLIKGLCDVGHLDQAQSLKLEISEPDTCTYTILICGMCRNGLITEAQNIFSEMEKHDCIPSVVTFNSLIHGLCKAEELRDAQLILHKMEMGKKLSLCLQLSQGTDRVLDRASLQKRVEKYCASGLIYKAYKLLMDLARSGAVPDIVTYNVLINGFCKAGNIRGALKLFEDLRLRGHSPDKITYGTIIDGLQRVGRAEDAFKFFEQMSKNGCTPGAEVYKSLMTWSCRNKKIYLAFDLWLKYLTDIRGEDRERIRIVENYLKEENLEMAVRGLLEIDSLSESFDAAPYNICLTGLCQVQRTEEALKLFCILAELDINVSGPSCVMLIHSLCRNGNLDQAINIFLYTMAKGFRLMPRICNNLLTCLLYSEEKAESVFFILQEMQFMGYNLDSYLYRSTKSLLSNRRRQLGDVAYG